MTAVKFFALAAMLALPVVVGCSGGDSSSAATDESADELRTTCGGIAGLRCSAGRTCVITSKVADASGTCHKICGGIAGLTCPSTQSCEFDGDHPDATGLCFTTAKAPASCGGIAGLRCSTGFKCQMTSHTPDALGTCVAD